MQAPERHAEKERLMNHAFSGLEQLNGGTR